jgi:tetratricopeptide (TPR) repeat protein
MRYAMNNVIKSQVILITVLTGLMIMSGLSYCQINAGQMASDFSLSDLNGKTYTLSRMKDQPMVILYFFDVESRPSQEGLISLNQIAKQYEEIDLNVWAITLSPRNKVSRFVKSTDLHFPVLLDTALVSDAYGARLVLPSVCIVGPQLRILDFFQGGGKTTEKMLVRLAERELQRRRTTIAKALSREVLRENPGNIKAQAVHGYSEIKENNIERAAEIFDNLALEGKEAEVLAQEGLAVVYVMKNENDKALRLIEEVIHTAPERAFVHVMKGNILYSQNRLKDAEQEYITAINKDMGETYQQASGYNQLGRYYAAAGNYGKARQLYEQAETIDPYHIESTTNKGLTYEKEGKWDKALASYRQALSLDRDDTFASVLAHKAQEMINLQKDLERKKRMDRLIKDLAERYHNQKKSTEDITDQWTSRPMVLSFVDIQEKGALSERDGFLTVLMTQLSNHLNASGRVRVVERVIIERLLEELNLGSSDLADKETSLRLGQVLAAKMIATGTLFYLPQQNLLTLKLIDTETSLIPHITIRHMETRAPLEKELFRLNREILKTVITKYPLRGYIVKNAGDQFIVNLGSRQGVVPGTKFDVIEDQDPIKHRGKLLRSSPKTIARIEVVRVEPDLSYVKVLNQKRPLRTDDKLEELIDEAAL